jgi:hypothetical protein
MFSFGHDMRGSQETGISSSLTYTQNWLLGWIPFEIARLAFDKEEEMTTSTTLQQALL